MPTYFQFFRTEVEDGVAVGDSELVTVALYAPDESIDPNDGADLRVIDSDGDGLISADEFRDATGGGGLGLNAGGSRLLFDGQPGSGNDGFLYSPAPLADGTDLNAFIDDIGQNFAPIDPEDVETDNPNQPPGNTPVCFTAGTLIDTPGGPRPVETLRAGDLVRTLDNGPQPIVWTGGMHLSVAALAAAPHRRPIRIRAGALGPGLPARDLTVSPQHRLLVASPVAERMFGVAEVLVPAKKLLALPGVNVLAGQEEVTYRHLLLSDHEILFAEATPSESLYNGPEARRALAELMDVDLADLGFGPGGATQTFTPARPFADGRRAERLISRHITNRKPLLERVPGAIPVV